MTGKQPAENDAIAQRDDLYYRLFSHPMMIQHLVQDFFQDIPEAGLDTGNAVRQTLDFIDATDGAEGAVAWRFQRKGGGEAYVIVVLDSLETDDRWMALRALNLQTQLLQQLAIEGTVAAGSGFPLIFTVVLYRGANPWQSPINLRDLIDTAHFPELRQYQPNARYKVIDMLRDPVDFLRLGDNMVARLILLVRSGADESFIERAFGEMFGRPE